MLILKFFGEKTHARIAKEILPKNYGEGTNLLGINKLELFNSIIIK